MRKLQRSVLAGAIALAIAASGNAAAQFTNVYFFGDSYTDMGSFKPVLPPGTGMFTTNPGPVWAQPFAQYFGFSASPANQGGNDYAYGGARVTLLPGYPPAAPTAAAVPIATQIQQLTAKGPLDPNAIYSVWGGANDFFTQYSDFQSGKITSAEAQANLGTAAVQLAQQIAGLHAGGAQYILVWNYPDVSKLPAYAGNPAIGQINAVVSLYYTTLLRRTQRLRGPDDPGQRAGARKRGGCQPDRLRVLERNDTGVPHTLVAGVHAREPCGAECGVDLPLRRRRPSDDCGQRDLCAGWRSR